MPVQLCLLDVELCLLNPKFENVPFALDRWNFAYGEGERRHWAN